MLRFTATGILVILLLLFEPPVQAGEKIILSTFMPSIFVRHCERVVVRAYERLGYDVELLHLPGERAIRLANDGEVDGELFRNPNVSRVYTNLVMIPVPVASDEIVVFSKKRIPVDGWESLRPYRIGVVIGFKLVEENTRGMRSVGMVSVEQAFRMLGRDRVDVVVESRTEWQGRIKTLGVKNIQVMEPPLVRVLVYHHLHKKHRALVPKLTGILRDMEEAGKSGGLASSVSGAAGDLPDVVFGCTDGQWPPYSFKKSENEAYSIGISCDILHEILLRQGRGVEVRTLPWKRCMDYVRNGTYHIVSDASRNPERDRNYLISNPVYKVRSGFFYLKSRYPAGPEIRTADDVNTYSLGGILGYNYDIYPFGTQNMDTGADGARKLVGKLRNGWIDLAVGYVEVFKYLHCTGEIDLGGIGWLDIPEATFLEYHYMFPRNKAGESLLRIINEGMAELRKDGTYQKIFRKYGIEY